MAMILIVSHVELPNGTAHRLAGYLQREGIDVEFLGLPFPGNMNYHEISTLTERKFALRPQMNRRVSWLASVSNFFRVRNFIKSMHSDLTGIQVIACDPLSFVYILLSNVGCPIKKRILYFVDYSAQRFVKRLSRLLYGFLCRLAINHADYVLTTSEDALYALRLRFSQQLLSTQTFVLPNLPLPFGGDVLRDSPRHGVIYMGGLKREQGALILPAIIEAIHARYAEIPFYLLGDGPLRHDLEIQLSGDTFVHFCGLVDSVNEIEKMLQMCRIGLALYEPKPSHHSTFGDPLKVKDYLYAGLCVVTTRRPIGSKMDSPFVISCPYDPIKVAQSVITLIEQEPWSAEDWHPQSDEIVQSSYRRAQTVLESINALE